MADETGPPPSKTEELLHEEDLLERLNTMWAFMTSREPVYFDAVIKNHIKPLAAKPGFASFSLTVPRSLCNAGGNLHGGAVALIFDICTSVAVLTSSRAGYWDTGHVSRTLNCTYLRPAPEGTELIVEAEVVHLGKQLAQLDGKMRRKDNGKICYLCEHGKAKVDFNALREAYESRKSKI